MQDTVTEIKFKICLPDHCYECPFWEETLSKRVDKNGESMNVCTFPIIPQWGRTFYERLGPDDEVPSCPLYDATKETRKLKKKAHWVMKKVRGETLPCCSACGLDTGTTYEYSFCPNCGKEME